MANRLASEPSLYLRQHADNPVDWYPWGEEALLRARELKRPILLSIGYSACHWCHVMARESFADPAIAALMNQHYVNIKVDREERPDLDKIYQLAHQALQRRGGGWPLTAFLDPQTLVPFFVGTYFPPERRYGMPGFAEVLQALARWYAERPDEVVQQIGALGGFLREYGSGAGHAGELDDAPLHRAYELWLAHADHAHGGTTGAPKFPHAGEIEVELQGEHDAARQHALRTLRAMAQGGLQDHIGGGFFRYCVDADWRIPHFEKMLYDNAQLLPLFAAAGATGDDELRDAAQGVVRWLQDEMPLPGGGYAAALDADSEHEEGRYYLWQADEFAALLPDADRGWLAQHFGLDQPPNFEGTAWHLSVHRPLEQIALARGTTVEQLRKRWFELRKPLKLARARRVPPARDDKLLASWNALLLSGLARSAQALQRSDWLGHALALGAALRRQLWHGERLHALAHGGKPHGRGLLDDHAASLVAMLDLVQAHWQAEDFDFAVALAEALLRDFEDREHGGFFLTPHDHEPLPQRPKPFIDESTPAGNGLAVQGLLRLGWWLGETRYLDAAERALRAGWATLNELPQAAASLLQGLKLWLRPPPMLVARFADHNEAERWASELDAVRHAGGQVLTIPAAESMLPGALAQKRWLAGGRVYWCEGLRCLPRLDSPVALQALRQRGGD